MSRWHPAATIPPSIIEDMDGASFSWGACELNIFEGSFYFYESIMHKSKTT